MQRVSKIALIAVAVGALLVPVVAIQADAHWPGSFLFFAIAALLPSPLYPTGPAVLVGALFVAWSVPVTVGKTRLSIASIGAAFVVAAASTAYFAASWPYALRFQGRAPVMAMVCANVIAIAAIGLIYCWNRRLPSVANALAFRVVVLIWMFSTASPWLGEMI